jgi:EAL domain-containing protein (putative c-di-GMP-specific phosphodiesterase class I)/GGDEF domain-containing protein
MRLSELRGAAVAVAGSFPERAPDLRQERDRYVAFAFASADLLLELDADGQVREAMGASFTVCGRGAEKIVDRDLAELFIAPDRGVLSRLLARLPQESRIDPVVLHVRHEGGAEPPVLFGGCCIPTLPDSRFITLTLIPPGAGAADRDARDPSTGLLSKEALLAAAGRASTDAVVAKPRSITMIRLGGLVAALEGLPEGSGPKLLQEIGAILRSRSLGGEMAGRLGEEEFGLVRSGEPNIDVLMQEIGDASLEAGLAENAIVPQTASLDLWVGDLTAQEAAKALAYAVKRFADAGDKDATDRLFAGGLSALMDRTVIQFGTLRGTIGREEFDLVFQPIVSLDTRALHHYEVLSRFKDGRSPYEVINFGEQVGLIEDLDLAVCRKAITALEANPGAIVAVNLSGRSIQSNGFRQILSGLLRTRPSLRSRLIFELTESSGVSDLADAAEFLRSLRGAGHVVCLDDFGAGAAAYNYLRHFEVDLVKIDGPFLRAALQRRRERALVASICHLCRELGSRTIGEMIEDEEGARGATNLGIDFGQGWLFGRPVPELPPPAPPRAVPAKRLIRARRKGVVTRWE